jgi:transcriptional regulator with XRE-family HTH domain
MSITRNTLYPTRIEQYGKMFLVDNKEVFSEWLSSVLRDRDLTQSGLASKAKINRAVISKAINKSSLPSPETCRAIAKALNIPEEIVLEKAGYLSSQTPDNEQIKKIAHLVSQMDDLDKRDVLEYAELVLRRSQRRDLISEFKIRYESIPRGKQEEVTKLLYEFLAAAGGRRLK